MMHPAMPILRNHPVETKRKGPLYILGPNVLSGHDVSLAGGRPSEVFIISGLLIPESNQSGTWWGGQGGHKSGGRGS